MSGKRDIRVSFTRAEMCRLTDAMESLIEDIDTYHGSAWSVDEAALLERLREARMQHDVKHGLVYGAQEFPA